MNSIGSQIELFNVNIFEIVKGSYYGNYGITEEGVLKAEFIGLDTACKFLRCRLADRGFRGSEIHYIENVCLQKYRQLEDA